jgi:hypothetical protein
MLRIHAVSSLSRASSWGDDFTLPPTEATFSLAETAIGRRMKFQQAYNIGNLSLHIVALAHELEKV